MRMYEMDIFNVWVGVCVCVCVCVFNTLSQQRNELCSPCSSSDGDCLPLLSSFLFVCVCVCVCVCGWVCVCVLTRPLNCRYLWWELTQYCCKVTRGRRNLRQSV